MKRRTQMKKIAAVVTLLGLAVTLAAFHAPKASPTPYNLNQLYCTVVTSDSFTGANQNPIDPTRWDTLDGRPTGDQLEVLNGELATTVGVNDAGIAMNKAVNWTDYRSGFGTDDQCASVTLENLNWNGGTGDGFVSISLRGTYNPPFGGPAYLLVMDGPFNDTTGTASLVVAQVDANNNAVYEWTDQEIVYHKGDVMSFMLMGGKYKRDVVPNYIQVFQNGNKVFSSLLSYSTAPPILTGVPGVSLYTTWNPPSNTNANIINWTAGVANCPLCTR
jgi:hypothetical protein